MTKRATWFRVLRQGFVVLALCHLFSTTALAADAELVMVLGRTEVGTSAQGPWSAASAQQKLSAGMFVRTLEGSQVALLLRDQTQVRLNQNSVLEIKWIQEGEGETSLSLLKGRLWAQVKQLTTGTLRAITRVASRPQVRIATPTATIGIRGTDWELIVGERDTTILTVFNGEVEMSNDVGKILVGINEQGVAEAGKAPVKSLLSNARDRVQWVTAYRPAPRRWIPNVAPPFDRPVRDIEIGEYARAMGEIERQPYSIERSLLLADMNIFLGHANDAIGVLEPVANRGSGDPMASALLARALMVAGRLDDASTLLLVAYKSYPVHRELVLALGDLARLQGDADGALRWFTEVTMGHSLSHEAWFGVGRVQTEKENVGPAEYALNEAIRLAPGTPGYYGERATLLALAGRSVAAKAAFEEALQRQPDDYLAWTGLGILQLKTGETREALDSFLKAGVIEPRFARAQLYIGVAYFQLGNQQRAVESVRKAAELDTKDPLPYVMLSLIHGDNQDLAQAVVDARQAQERMPYLKSLNQLLNNQKGSANVGAALASRGMEEWAQNHATGAHNPYWAGSAFFLADRYPDGFNKNSELYRGFLLDPISFGASNRFSSLVASPGHYGSVGGRLERGDFDQGSVQAALNGLSTSTIPFAYSLINEYASGHTVPSSFSGDGGNFTLGLGAKPNHDLNLFYFGTRSAVKGDFSDQPSSTVAALSAAPLDVKIARQDVGLAFRLAPENRVMLKIGDATQRTQLNGGLSNPAQASELDATFATIPNMVPFSSAGKLDNYGVRIEQTDMQFAHYFNLSPTLRMSWGYEYGRDERSLNFARTFQSGFTPLYPVFLQDDVQRTLKSSDIYGSLRGKFSDGVEWQGEMAYQELVGSTRLRQQLDLVGFDKLSDLDTPEIDDQRGLNPRLGVRFSQTTGQQFRLVAQQWRRPMGFASLGSVDTLGIPLEDRLVEPGGLLRRLRVQYDWQLGSESFMQVFADRRQVKNLTSATKPLFALFGVTELNSLRAKRPLFAQPFDDLEDTPIFDEGDVSSLGTAGNWMINKDWSISARYRFSDSRNTAVIYTGFKVPFIPTHFGNASIYWQASPRWLAAFTATYRSARFSDESNLSTLNAGFVFGVSGYWESEDKHWSMEAGIANLHAGGDISNERRTKLIMGANYRF